MHKEMKKQGPVTTGSEKVMSLVSAHEVRIIYAVTCRLKGQQWSLRSVPIYSDFIVETEISTVFLGGW